jgi:hypothetical protein
MGRADGPSRGRDGNVHLGDLDRGQIMLVSHLPAMLPVAVGCALAFRIRDERRVLAEEAATVLADAWFARGHGGRGRTWFIFAAGLTSSQSGSSASERRPF